MRLLAAALAFAATSASAQFAGLLKSSPAEVFNETDLRLFRDTARKLLEEAADNQPLAWENPDNRHRGDMTVLKSFESSGRACKRVRVRNQADGRKSDMQHNLCRVDGRWRLVGDLKTGEKK